MEETVSEKNNRSHAVQPSLPVLQQNHGVHQKFVISDNEKDWLQANYPEMVFVYEADDLTIVGRLSFDMVFQGLGKPYIINPDSGSEYSGTRIQDTYQVKIALRSCEYSNLPQVYEIGSRIEMLRQALGLRLADFHINENGAACLCIKTEEEEKLPNGFNLQDFIYRLVIPFFFAQSYVEKYGTWPWGQYSHGDLGLLEWFANQDQMTEEGIGRFLEMLQKNPRWNNVRTEIWKRGGIKGHHRCICGNKSPYRRCHPNVLRGLWKLRQDVVRFSLQI